jgi:hypothetical protein
MRFYLCVLLAAFSMIHCGSSQGGSEAGNPPSTTRSLIGNVAASSTCQADEVIATDSTGVETTATPGSNCSFTLTLDIDNAYQLAFYLSSELLATMVFDNGGNNTESTTVIISAGTTDIDMGEILFSNSVAVPEFEPSTQNDQDDDGVDDYDDDDDDDDGIDDDDEEDCDEDGYSNDHDDDDECEDDDD